MRTLTIIDATKRPARIVAGTVTLPTDDLVDMHIVTKDGHLRDILLWAVLNPLPGYTGGDDGLAPHLVGSNVALGDSNYERSLVEYLTQYGYAVAS